MWVHSNVAMEMKWHHSFSTVLNASQ